MKQALILGGTRGLGLSLAWEGYTRQVRPIITGRSADLQTLASFPPSYAFFKLDLSNPESVEQIGRRKAEPIDYLFWVAGNFYRGPFDQTSPEILESMIATHLSGPVRALELFQLGLHYILNRPYHLITIASTSSWRIRENESLYCALKAAKAAFTRNFARELVRDLPGSKVTLINPGGLKTPNVWKNSGQDISKFMDPNEVAKIIWNEIERQEEPFKEVNILRKSDGGHNISYGPRIPEQPFWGD